MECQTCEDRMKLPDDNERSFWFQNGLGASEADIEGAEKYVGELLPNKFKALLRIRDGGVARFAAYDDGELLSRSCQFLV